VTQQASRKSVFPARIAPYIDIAAYLLDARAPASTFWLDGTLSGKELVILTRTDQADPRLTREWQRYFRAAGFRCICIDSISGKGYRAVMDYLALMLKRKAALAARLGIKNPVLKLAALGVPNVGKSTFLNRLIGGRKLRTGDAPGVTKGPQWVRVFQDVEVLDTAGILRDAAMLNRRKPFWLLLNLMPYDESLRDGVVKLLRERLDAIGLRKLARFYKLRPDELAELDTVGFLAAVASRHGGKAGSSDALDRAARRLVRDFQIGRFGRATLERPGDDPITSPHFAAPAAWDSAASRRPARGS